jgi:hypothetical protein
MTGDSHDGSGCMRQWALAGSWHDHVQNPTTSEYTRGALYGLAAVCIWAAFIVVTRLGVRTSLTPWDVAAIRFTVAGALLFPYVIRKGLALERLGWIGLAAIILGCGAPMVLLVNLGLLFAPAAHGGAVFPGVMPLMVAILAAAILKEAFTSQKTVGLALIVLGAVAIVWITGGGLGTTQNVGHALFSRRWTSLGLLHRRHAACTSRWTPCRRHCRRRVTRALSTDLRVHCRNQRLQGPTI